MSIARPAAPKAAAVDRPPLETYLTVADVAKVLRRCTATIYVWIREGRIPAPLRLPGSRRPVWPAAQIKEWLASLVSEVPDATS
jgi:excisionase family DNA binding protein